ncbi:unconventional myosin-XVB-like [Mobula hypostoma]|uniref:unconventional myosin-XVB-like n=1 Tax=Mobula hypostoma TaxID=723540 RepID=UPI002FC277A2
MTLYSEKAKQAKVLITVFLDELRKDSKYVMAVKSYITDDKSLLNMRKGDIIKLLPMDGLEPGWLFGSVGGRSGLFPEDQVQPTAAPDYYNVSGERNEERSRSMPISRRSSIKTSPPLSEVSESNEAGTTISSNSASVIKSASSIYSLPEHGQYVMVEFAMKYFREPVTTPELKNMSAEEKKPNYLVRHTKVPIQQSLLYLVDEELNELATQNFMAVMRFMGDQPLKKKRSDIDYLESILKLCKKKKLLLDEVCCQIIKQITDNPKNESCIKGWRMLHIFLGYYPCSNNLAPYVTSYLQEISINPNHPFQEIAKLCQENIQRTLEFGGRQHLPSNLEMAACAKGRSSRRINVQLPGKLVHVSKIKPFTVGHELVMEICATIGITDTEEAKEFSLIADKDNGKVAKPIRWSEYLFDFLLDDNSVKFYFQRIIWKEPLRFYNDLYIDLHYNQVVPIYLKGQLLLPNNISEAEHHIAILAAYQFKGSTENPEPTKQQLKMYLPKTLRKMNTDAVLRQTLQELNAMHHLSAVEAKMHFLTAVHTMPLFGYNIFVVKKTSSFLIPVPCIMAFNEEDLMVLSEEGKEKHLRIPMREIQMMRMKRATDESSFPLMEINYGSPVKPYMITFEVKEAKKICHMIGMILDDILQTTYT